MLATVCRTRIGPSSESLNAVPSIASATVALSYIVSLNGCPFLSHVSSIRSRPPSQHSHLSTTVDQSGNSQPLPAPFSSLKCSAVLAETPFVLPRKSAAE
ncbi:hypothetical protein BJY04DRAFT_202480 [Aspergillus karnatakaensis]|uniref:uncharacterized protein n=1 Tax=Aspergillus karnatakaensis TaxID=1810916 RepID=UPI003CCE177A